MLVYDPRFALPPQPPFPAGQGRFRLRGAACADEMLFHRERLGPAQMEEALRALPGDEWRRYVQQSFTRLAWYDLLPSLYFVAAAAKVLQVSLTAHVKAVGEWHAERALAGLSGLVLRALDIDSLSLWLPRIAKTMHDFGDLETTRLSPGRVRGVRTGVPQFLVHNWAIVSIAFVERTLALRGARNAHVVTMEPSQDGERFGHPTFRIPFEIAWDLTGR
jgi:hypothetical protein